MNLQRLKDSELALLVMQLRQDQTLLEGAETELMHRLKTNSRQELTKKVNEEFRLNQIKTRREEDKVTSKGTILTFSKMSEGGEAYEVVSSWRGFRHFEKNSVSFLRQINGPRFRYLYIGEFRNKLCFPVQINDGSPSEYENSKPEERGIITLEDQSEDYEESPRAEISARPGRTYLHSEFGVIEEFEAGFKKIGGNLVAFNLYRLHDRPLFVEIASDKSHEVLKKTDSPPKFYRDFQGYKHIIPYSNPLQF